jgi:hypothetical protein
MFGPSIKQVFKSKWHALIWASFILLTAYCTVPSKDDPNSGINAAVSVVANHADKQAGHHANPWAKDNR